MSVCGKEVAANDEFIEEFDCEDITDDPPKMDKKMSLMLLEKVRMALIV